MESLQLRQEAEIAKSQELTADLYTRYIRFLDASPKTVATYTRAVKQLFNYLNSKGIAKPTREDIIAYKDYLTDSGHKPSTVQSYIVAARLFFVWTEQEGIYPNIAAHIKAPKLSRDHKKDYLTSKQVKALLSSVERDTLTGKRDYAILCLCITGGLRTIEVSRANIEDLGTVADDSVLYLQGKGRTERTEYIKLSPQVEEAVRDYLKARGTTDGKAPLFASESNNSKGKRITTRTVSGIVKDHLRDAGYNSERLTAHSLRHTAVTLSIMAGKPLEEVQQFARHANPQTTLIYVHSLDRAKNSCSAAIANAIF